MRFFIEPVALAVAHAKRLGYRHVALAGLSGGGWTTTVAAAVLPAVTLSVPIAGSVPKWRTAAYDRWVPNIPAGRNLAAVSPDPFHPPPVEGASGDYEQQRARPFYDVVGGFAEARAARTAPPRPPLTRPRPSSAVRARLARGGARAAADPA